MPVALQWWHPHLTDGPCYYIDSPSRNSGSWPGSLDVVTGNGIGEKELKNETKSEEINFGFFATDAVDGAESLLIS
jgi:hypothetical protein